MKDIAFIVGVISVFILFSYVLVRLFQIQENWEVYKQKPLGYVKTGSEPMNYYVRKRYRKPYRYPFQIVKENPIKHLSYLD